jgi:hypothetical protein
MDEPGSANFPREVDEAYRERSLRFGHWQFAAARLSVRSRTERRGSCHRELR